MLDIKFKKPQLNIQQNIISQLFTLQQFRHAKMLTAIIVMETINGQQGKDVPGAAAAL